MTTMSFGVGVRTKRSGTRSGRFDNTRISPCVKNSLGRFSRAHPLSVVGPLSSEDPVVVDDELGRQKRTRVEPEPR